MLDKILEMFEEDNGRLSSIRILNFIIVIGIIMKMVKTGTAPSFEEIGLVLGCLGIKSYQKGKEQKCLTCPEDESKEKE